MVSRVTQTFPRRICSALDEHSYQKNNIELSRIATQKHKLKDLLKDNYDSSLSESQNMIANGWLQVYDCGTIKMEYHKT